MNLTKLVISPHADDEVIGCGGILDEDTHVFYCGINESQMKEGETQIHERKKEIEEVSNFFKFTYTINHTNFVNKYEVFPLIEQIEKIINEVKPQRIYIPFPSYNQDHRTVYEASRIALRPHDRNWFVKQVLTFEQPHAIIWEEKDFKVQYFVPIDVERKITGYLLHKSQVRVFRSPNMIREIAKLRGSSIGRDHAEAYRIERWVE